MLIRWSVLSTCFFKCLFIYLFIFGCVGSSFSMRGLPLVAASGGHSSSRCAGFSLPRPLLLPSTGSRCAGSVVVAHGPSCSAACGILPDQGLNPCPLHWQADSQPLRHQGSPYLFFIPISPFLVMCSWGMAAAWRGLPKDLKILKMKLAPKRQQVMKENRVMQIPLEVSEL